MTGSQRLWYWVFCLLLAFWVTQAVDGSALTRVWLWTVYVLLLVFTSILWYRDKERGALISAYIKLNIVYWLVELIKIINRWANDALKQ